MPSPAQPGSPPPRQLRVEDRIQLGWLDGLIRHRRWAFGLVVLVYVLSFNGLWRVGFDSALYRSLARSLVMGRGYTVAGEAHHHAFPGMPLLLAALDRVFGERDFPAVLVVTLMGLATLLYTYRLIALRFPMWIATVVTIGVGLNYRVVRQSQELMTDVPFLLGVVLTFYGLERLRLACRAGPLMRRVNLVPAFYMVGGLALGAVMRPTFGVLGGAILVAGVIRLLTNSDGRRSLHAITVACVCVVTALLAFSDPRTSGRIPFKGAVYEEELVYGVNNLPKKIRQQLEDLLARDLNDAFYSQDMAVKRVQVAGVAPMSLIFSGLLLVGTWFVLRRDMAWGFSILGIMAITLPLSTVPRYYIMVMPFLWLGWLVLLSHLTLRVPHIAKGAVMMLGILLPLGLNLGRIGGLILEQRSAEIGVLTGKAPDRATAFYQVFRDGQVFDWQRWGKMIRDHVPANARVVGPEANVLAWYSDRKVFGERAIFVDRPVRQYPAILAAWKPDFAIFPSARYSDTDSRLRDLINRRILTRDTTIARDVQRVQRDGHEKLEETYLSSVEVRLPRDPENWREPRVSRSSTQPSTQPATHTTKSKKKKKHSSNTAHPTTQSVTAAHPTSQPHSDTTQPATPAKKRKKPTTHSTTSVAAATHPTGKTAAQRRDARDARQAREARERRERAAAATQPTH